MNPAKSSKPVYSKLVLRIYVNGETLISQKNIKNRIWGAHTQPGKRVYSKLILRFLLSHGNLLIITHKESRFDSKPIGLSVAIQNT